MCETVCVMRQMLRQRTCASLYSLIILFFSDELITAAPAAAFRVEHKRIVWPYLQIKVDAWQEEQRHARSLDGLLQDCRFIVGLTRDARHQRRVYSL